MSESASIVTLSGINKTFHRGKEAIHVLENLGPVDALQGNASLGRVELLGRRAVLWF